MRSKSLPVYASVLIVLVWGSCVVTASRPLSAGHFSSSSSSSTAATIKTTTFTTTTTSSSSSRSLLGSAACAAASSRLLTNGYFRLGDGDAHLSNALVAATMSNDVYPWSREIIGASVAQVVEGLTPEQVTVFQEKFTGKYLKLGASSVKFVDYYSPGKEVAAHAVVIGTPRSVFLVFRGTADMGQFITTMDPSSVTTTIFNKTVELYQAPYRSVMGAWPEILSTVEQALRATVDPETAAIVLAGHSLGGASAFLAALLLEERGFKVGGVYAFGPYKMGTTCAPEDECWVTVYDRHLASVTHVWWNNQDPIPGFLDYMDGTSGEKSRWGHVPRNTGWTRVVRNECIPASGTRLEEPCPPEIDATDGKADGKCSDATFLPHMQWNYVRKVAGCTLLQNPQNAADNGSSTGRPSSTLRVDTCSTGAVWRDLLGLPVPSDIELESTSAELALSQLRGATLDKRLHALQSGAKPGPKR